MIIAVCGYGTSGASAVLDFLRGYDNLQIVPFVQVLSRSSFHNTCHLTIGSQAQVSAYKRPQSLPFHLDFNNSAKITKNTIYILSLLNQDPTPNNFQNSEMNWMKFIPNLKP